MKKCVQNKLFWGVFLQVWADLWQISAFFHQKSTYFAATITVITSVPPRLSCFTRDQK